jgi:hypothetical protein
LFQSSDHAFGYRIRQPWIDRDTINPVKLDGNRLSYESFTDPAEDLKEGVFLEAGFDDVAPNVARDISSWMYDYAVEKAVDIIDNRAKAVPCYDPGYTLVEKLQTISTKFRHQQESGGSPASFMRHYYDIYSLLQRPEVQAFVGTAAYTAHKDKRFPAADNQDISTNEAFKLSDAKTRATYKAAHEKTSALYYKDKPTFEQILQTRADWAARL